MNQRSLLALTPLCFALACGSTDSGTMPLPTTGVAGMAQSVAGSTGVGVMPGVAGMTAVATGGTPAVVSMGGTPGVIPTPMTGGMPAMATGGAPMMPMGQGGTDPMMMTGGTGTGGQPAMEVTGESLYQLNCFPCHGAEGMGTELLGPEIQHSAPEYAEWLVRNGRDSTDFAGPMIAIDQQTLSDEDLALIIEYLDSFPQPTTGQALYEDYCANCHGFDANGGPTMRDLSNHANFNDVRDNVNSGHGNGNVANRRDYMPVWLSTKLNEAEMMLIADYMATL